MVKIYTSQLRYSGIHRLDITVKGQDPTGKLFAPTWNMVMAHKHTGNDKKYIIKYHNIIRASYCTHRNVWEDILKREYVVFVCFCGAGKFCHRILLAEEFAKYGASYLGEISTDGKSFITPLIK